MSSPDPSHAPPASPLWRALCALAFLALLGLILVELRPPAPPPPGQASELPWSSDPPAALRAAQQAGKPLLVAFTGSDWCPPCQRLEAEVFASPEFARWSQGRVLLLRADFPRTFELPAEQAAANRALARRLEVQSFPTVHFLDAQGASLGKLGYVPGGPEPWIAAAEEILRSR